MVKQARTRSNLLATNAVTIEIELCLSILCRVTEIDTSDIDQFFRKLATFNSLNDQIKHIQTSKGMIRKRIVEEISVDCTNIVESLTYFYIHPAHEPLRKYLEWIVECFTRRVERCNDVLNAVSSACHQIWGAFEVELSSLIQSSSSGECELSQWVACLGAMATLQKDIPWLSIPFRDIDITLESSVSLSVSSLRPDHEYHNQLSAQKIPFRLLKFLQTSAKLCRYCSQDMIATSDSQVRSSVGLLHLSESCGEMLRIIMIVLKGSYHTALDCRGYELWQVELNNLVSNCIQLLCCEFSTKDCITSAAMVVVCVQWWCRHAIGNDHTVGPVILDQLMQLIINDNIPSHTECRLLPSLSSSIALNTRLQPLSTCGLMRAILSVFDSQSLFTVIDKNSNKPLLLGVLFDSVTTTCYHNIPEIRLYGLQTLESWFNRLTDLIHSISGTSQSPLLVEMIVSNMFSVSTLLTSAWSHPTKQVNHMVPTIYQNLVDTLHLIMVVQEQEEEAGGIRNEEFWKPFLMDVLTQPAQHRGRYQAMTILLPKVGAERLLALEPRLIPTLIDALGLRDVASSSCILLGALLRALLPVSVTTELKSENNQIDHTKNDESSAKKRKIELSQKDNSVADNALLSSWRELWVNHICRAMTATDRKICINIADYLVPEVMKIDPRSAPVLLRAINELFHQQCCTQVQRLWAMCSVVLHARLSGLLGSEIVVEDAMTVMDNSQGVFLNEKDIRMACLSHDIDLRLLALTTVTASQKTTAEMPSREMEIFKDSLGFSLKSSQSEHRQHLVRAMKAVLLRLSEGVRIAVRENKRNNSKIRELEKDKSNLSTTTMLPSEIELKSQEIEQKIAAAIAMNINYQNQSDDFKVFCNWLCEELLMNLYPGSTSDKEIICLDLLNAILEFFKTQQLDPETLSVMMVQFINYKTTRTIINLIVRSSWDRTRHMAAELLVVFAEYGALPSFSSPEEVNRLVYWAATLMGSPRQRESDAGSLLMKNLFAIYAIRLQWSVASAADTQHNHAMEIETDVNTAVVAVAAVDRHHSEFPMFVATKAAVSEELSQSNSKSSLLFLNHLCTVLQTRLISVDKLFACIQDVDALAALSLDSPASASATASEVNVVNDPLCHGVIMAIRYCLSAANNSQLLRDSNNYIIESDGASSNMTISWAILGSRLVETTLQSLHVAMKVVAEAKSDVPFACQAINSVHDATATTRSIQHMGPNDRNDGVKGPIQSHTSHNPMAATYMNTNSNMGAAATAVSGGCSGDGHDAADGDEVTSGDVKGSVFQRAVVAAWLMVKEACALFALLVELSPPPPSDSGTTAITTRTIPKPKAKHPSAGTGRPDNIVTVTSNALFLSVEDITRVGDTILDALGRLKHMGAISEAQSALQSIAQTLLRYGDRCMRLCQLPTIWLQFVLSRLENESQVFILRRSAGFAYSFLSLLRAEPAKCVPTLLPVAMEKLFQTIVRGLPHSNNTSFLPCFAGSAASSNADSWRMCVHALNVTRLIILDAILAPSLDPYIAQATILAVTGFQSPHWAVRNSCMMVFAAVVQRVVDNDKHDSGGSKASTVAEFFQRFPDLFPFLLAELRTIVVSSSKTSIQPIRETNVDDDAVDEDDRAMIADDTFKLLHDAGDNVYPSLFPILLILSKLRAVLMESSTSTMQLTNGDIDVNSDNSGKSGFFFDISLFVPLVEHCTKQRMQKAREMAAKAMASLIPVSRFAEMSSMICGALIADLEQQRARRIAAPETRDQYIKLCYNSVHGQLLTMQELLDSARRHVGSSSNGKQTTSSTATTGTSTPTDTAGDSMYQQLVDKLATEMLPKLHVLIGMLSDHSVPILHRTLMKILVVINDMLQTTTANANYVDRVEALIVYQSKVVMKLFSGISFSCEGIITSELSFSASNTAYYLSLNPTIRAACSLPYAALTLREILQAVLPILLKRQLLNQTALHMQCLAGWLLLLSHPVSEIREGVILGMHNFIALHDIASIKQPSNPFWSQFLSSSIDASLRHIQHEVEPPVLTATTELLCLLSQRIIHLESQSIDTKKLLLHDYWDSVLDVVVLPAATRKRKITSSLSTSNAYSRQDTLHSFNHSDVISTTAGAGAMEMLGFLLWCALGYNASLSISAGPSSYQQILAILPRIQIWIQLLETTADEEQGQELRLAAAQSILNSSLLQLLFRVIASPLQVNNDGNNRKHMAPLSEVACRLWLVLLKLLQDDDDDVRDVANVCVASTRETSSNPYLIVQAQTLQLCGSQLSSALKFNLLVADGRCLELVVKTWEQTIGAGQNLLTILLSQESDTTTRKIFDAEQANLYLETVVQGQVLMDSLGDSLRNDSMFVAAAVVQDSLTRVHREVQCAIKILLLVLGQPSRYSSIYPMGVTYEKDVFAHLFACLYAYRVLDMNWSASLEELKLLVSQATNADLHPWIAKELLRMFEV